MSRIINISDNAYQWLLKKSSRQSIEKNKNVSMANVVDELIENKEKGR